MANIQGEYDDFLAPPDLISIGQLIGHYYADRYLSNVPCRTSKLSGEDWTQELLEGHPVRFRENARMDRHIFKKLSQRLRRDGILNDTRHCSIEQQLLLFLFICGQAQSTRAAQERFQHSAETIFRHFRGVLSALKTLSPEYLRLPNATRVPPEV